MSYSFTYINMDASQSHIKKQVTEECLQYNLYDVQKHTKLSNTPSILYYNVSKQINKKETKTKSRFIRHL